MASIGSSSQGLPIRSMVKDLPITSAMEELSLSPLSEEPQFPLSNHTFCCPNVELNFPSTPDGYPGMANRYFKEFITYANTQHISLAPPTFAPHILMIASHYFEVSIMVHTPAVDSQGATFVRRETRLVRYAPAGGAFYELHRGDLVPGHHDPPRFDDEPPASPLILMWRCPGTGEHHTQLVVFMHHRHYDTDDVQLLREGCILCDSRVEQQLAEIDFNTMLGHAGFAVDGSLPDEFNWETMMLVEMGLTGREPIIEMGCCEIDHEGDAELGKALEI